MKATHRTAVLYRRRLLDRREKMARTEARERILAHAFIDSPCQKQSQKQLASRPLKLVDG